MFFTTTEVIGISWLSGRLCSLSGVRRAVPAVPGEAGLGRWELEDLTGKISNLQWGNMLEHTWDSADCHPSGGRHCRGNASPGS